MTSMKLIALLTILFCLHVPCASAEPDAMVPIASHDGQPAQIVISTTDPLMQRTAEWCINYLGVRRYAVSSQVAHALPAGTNALWIFETEDHHPAADALGLSTDFLKTARADAYILAVITVKERPIVLIVGRNTLGVRSGLARLIALGSEKEQQFLVPGQTLEMTPFIPIRRLHVCVTGRIAQDGERRWADTLWTNWSDDRIRTLAEELWLMGFNSIEVPEIRGYRGIYTDDQLKNEITPKLRVFMQALKDNGLQVSQFIWGQSLFEEGRNYCWNDPTEREGMLKEYDRLAKTYGDRVDHVVVHVGDPGGCNRNGCDAYKTTQAIATALLEAYRKVNPNVTVTLSTWANKGFFNGAKDEPFLDTKYSPQEIAIALHRWYEPDQARRVRDAGREVDIWGWYLSDYELALDWTLFMRRLDKYYTALPDQASEDIRALSTEINFLGWPQMINAYVTAQKMWSPKRSIEEIEREYCTGLWGDQHADAMLTVYRAVEKHVHPGRFYAFIPQTDCPPVVFGTADYNRELTEAMQGCRNVAYEESFQPRMTTATPNSTIKKDLLRRLHLLSALSNTHQRIADEREKGTPPEVLAQIADQAAKLSGSFRDDPDRQAMIQDLVRFAAPPAPSAEEGKK